MYESRIKDFDDTEQPRERLKRYGASVLSNAELLAIIIGSGGKNISALTLAQFVLKKFNGFKGLVQANITELTSCKHIGLAKACSMLAACEVALRIRDANIITTATTNPEDIYKYIKKDFYAQSKELLFIVCLSIRNKIISKELVSVGTLNETLIHPREVFKIAFSKHAASIILVHNHPSGDPTPSLEDIRITQRIYTAGLNLGIHLIDHLIVTDTTYRSLKSLGLLLKGGE